LSIRKPKKRQRNETVSILVGYPDSSGRIRGQFLPAAERHHGAFAYNAQCRGWDFLLPALRGADSLWQRGYPSFAGPGYRSYMYQKIKGGKK
jgi:hypothetical protein